MKLYSQEQMSDYNIQILGIRGIPASHGGFETFAEVLSLYLLNAGWRVTVYCQEEGGGELYTDTWNDIERIIIPVKKKAAIGTVIFDWKSTKHASRHEGLILTLGYNTAIFSILYRLRGKKNIINMDGIEWKRGKWKWYERIWLYLNERVGCLFGNHLIADHPEIKNHLKTRVKDSKITMIPYGAREVLHADLTYIHKYGLKEKAYAILIARPEPENSILEIVRAFSRVKRNHKLVVLGNYLSDNAYHQEVITNASNEIVFLGAIYEHNELDALRLFASLYIHGHTVGGTNPSLVEALAAGQPVLAHDNKYNNWVAGSKAHYFKNENDCALELDKLLQNDAELCLMSGWSRERFKKEFTWDRVLGAYENLLINWL